MSKLTYPCPLCGRKHYSKQQVIACMDLDQKEEKQPRKLKPLKFIENGCNIIEKTKL